MGTKKTEKPKVQNQKINEEDLPVIDLSSCESFDPSCDQFLKDDDSCDEDYDFE